MNRHQSRLMFSHKTNDWATPETLYKTLDAKFHFDYDPCPINEPKLREFDGRGDAPNSVTSIYLNPPYGDEIREWIQWAIKQWVKGCAVVVLLPVRTNTKWAQELVLIGATIVMRPEDVICGKYLFFIPRKLKFGNHVNEAPFPSMLLILMPDPEITRKRQSSHDRPIPL